MTDNEKLVVLKTILNIEGSSDDSLLSVYLSLAASKILRKAYPYDSSKTEVPLSYAHLQCEIAVYLYNKRGAEGQSYHSENGINRAYENADIPKSMLASVIPLAEVI